jgi:hypothetical protein
MALSKIGNNILGIALGAGVAKLSDVLTDRIRVHRREVMPESTLTQPDSVTDLSLDALCQLIFIMLGVNFVTRSVDSVSSEMDTMLFFIIGFSSQTTFQTTVRNLTKALASNPAAPVTPTATTTSPTN